MKRYLRLPALLVAGVLALGLAGGCKDMFGGSSDKSVDKNSLYSRLGGHDAIVKVVDEFVAIAAADPKVNFTRKSPPHPHTWDATPENVAKLKKHLVQFISMATNGPKEYDGLKMDAAHAGMGISDSEFGAIAADLKTAMTKVGVSDALQAEVIAVVATTKGDIVGK